MAGGGQEGIKLMEDTPGQNPLFCFKTFCVNPGSHNRDFEKIFYSITHVLAVGYRVNPDLGIHCFGEKTKQMKSIVVPK